MIRAACTALAITFALLMGIAVAAPASATAEDNCGQYDFDVNWDAIKGKKVALVIHGWTGTRMSETVQLLQQRLSADEWAVLPFSYESTNVDWPAPGGNAVNCLREVISQYGAATELAEPSVYLVGHSMGGILARVALDRDDRYQYDQLVGGVVTLDTPHKGSPWGASIPADLLEGRDDNAPGFSAARCLALHHPGAFPDGCHSPPAITSSIPVFQIAGIVTFTRSFFGLGRQELDSDSDGIVWQPSQVGYGTSVDEPLPDESQSTSATVRCTFGAIVPWKSRTAIQSGTRDFLSDSNANALLGSAGLNASCGHSNNPKNAEALDLVAQKLIGWADARRIPERWLIDATGIGPLKIGASVPDVETLEAIVGPEHGLCNPASRGNFGIDVNPGTDGIVSAILLLGSPSDTAPATRAGLTLGSHVSELAPLGASSRDWKELGWTIHTWTEDGTVFTAQVNPDGFITGLSVGEMAYYLDYC